MHQVDTVTLSTLGRSYVFICHVGKSRMRCKPSIDIYLR